MADHGSYDPEMHQYREASAVKPRSLVFLRWAVATGRLRHDGTPYHAYMATDIEPCEGMPKCGICAHCCGVLP
jgi:hypothetical protein